ncbi:MAG: DUF4261 domain-containing protein [Pyrinomonadaceae bacterium]|nr:DUF4261 domain-containing protein [Pyrinomonadaceae bacterium]
MRNKRAVLAFCLVCFVVNEAQADVLATKEKANHLAFVLLSEARVPKGEKIASAFASIAPKGQRLSLRGSKTDKAAQTDILEFDLSSGGLVLIALMPVAVPNREADDAVQFSVSAMGTGWKLPVHKAHLVVSLRDVDGTLETLTQFTSLVAAVTEVSPAVGIYWGAAGATHDPKFFVSIVREGEGALPIMLWIGLSVAREKDGRRSLLSRGMKQLNLPDLLLLAPKSAGTEVLTTFWDFLNYLAEFGKPLPEGDTIGRSETERLPVHYVPSPIDPSIKVWRVELDPPTILRAPPR